jgi:hypothetical protein
MVPARDSTRFNGGAAIHVQQLRRHGEYSPVLLLLATVVDVVTIPPNTPTLKLIPDMCAC